MSLGVRVLVRVPRSSLKLHAFGQKNQTRKKAVVVTRETDRKT